MIGADQPLKPDHPLATKRAEVEQKVLANLLRLNHARATAGGAPRAPAVPNKTRRECRSQKADRPA